MEEQELKFDIKSLSNFLKKNKTLFLILIPLFFAIFFRAYTYDLPLTDRMAEQTIENSLRSQLQNEVLSQTSDIDQNTLDTLVQQRYIAFMQENKEAIAQQKEQISQQIKQYYKDDSGQTYLLAIDPYHYYRQAQNILENGHVGDELKDGKSLDNHMLAPNGLIVHNSFHPWIGATLHKVSQVFGNDSLMKTMFILPLIFSALSVIPAFFITRKVAGNLGGSVAAFILAIHPVLLGRTPAGFSDTDAYSIFFPLMIIWIFSEAFTTNSKRNKYFLSGAAGLVTGIFAFAWGGWWYIFDILLASLAIYFIYLLVKYRNKVFQKIKTKNLIRVTLTYIITSLAFVTLFTNFATFLSFFKGPTGVVFIKEAARSTLWPNVYTTVAELNSVNLTQVIATLNGKLIFSLAAIGLLLTFFKRKKLQSDIKLGITLVIWFIVTLYTATKGARFIMFLVPIFAIGLGIIYGKIYSLITNWASRELDINKKLIASGLIILAVVSLIPLTKAANNTALHEVPSMNDIWYESLTKIKQETPENSIVNSWWDFGHWFKAISDRAVTFDGATQDQPMAHWMGKALLTDNEEESIAILRMLDCGSNDAYDLLLEETNDPILTKKIIDEIILENKNSAKSTLQEYTNDPEKILEKTHCNPPDNYFITSEDMVSKAGVWAHFGSWDFERSFAYNTIKSNSKEEAITILIEKLDYTQEEAESTFRQLNGLDDSQANNWIAPYPSYSNRGQCQTQNETVYCSNGLVIYPDNKVEIQTEQGSIPIKNYRDDKGTYTNEEGTDEVSAAYNPETSISVLMHPSLLNSMFTELFYYEGKNLNNFELFDHRAGVDAFDIYVWKVKWISQ